MNTTKDRLSQSVPEYEYKNGRGGWSKYEGERIVHNRIIEALEAAGIDDARFEVKMMEIGYKYKVTRVYAGGHLAGRGYRRGGSNKSFIQSKRDEAIDLERVIEFIVEKNDELKSADAKQDFQLSIERVSERVAEGLCDEFGLTPYSNLSVEGSSGFNRDATQVVVSFKKQCSVEDARKLIKLLKQHA